MQWMEKYLPVITSSDSCEGAADDWLGVDNDCVCSTANETLETVAQGRVQLYGDRGFGLHLVNTSFKLTTGGLSVAAVEAVFEERLNDMAHFDAYMDYSVAFYAPPTGPRALDAFVEAFDADNVSYYPYTHRVCMPAAAVARATAKRPALSSASILRYRWTNGTSGNASTFYGLFVHVPSSMLVVELMSNASAGVPRRVPRDREISDARGRRRRTSRTRRSWSGACRRARSTTRSPTLTKPTTWRTRPSRSSPSRARRLGFRRRERVSSVAVVRALSWRRAGRRSAARRRRTSTPRSRSTARSTCRRPTPTTRPRSARRASSGGPRTSRSATRSGPRSRASTRSPTSRPC